MLWHQHRSPDCPLRSKPRSNVGYWNAKLARNVERDQETLAKLETLGWRPVTIWECETRNSEALRARLQVELSQ